MTSPVAWAAALAASIAAPVSATTQGSGMVALEALGRALRGESAWTTEYTQEYIAAGMGGGELVSGVVVMAWPDRALFRAGDPVTQMMGLDGRRVRLIDLSVPSCDDHVLDDDEWARVPLAAVLDPRGAVDRFAILEHGEHGFTLVPREAGGIDRVEVVLGDDNLPAEVVVVDPQGATNTLRFSSWRAVAEPAADAWLPEAPAGLDCVSDTGPES